MIKLLNITKVYEKKEVVKDLSLEIEKGKITALVGENGAGKSTVLSMIARFMKVNNGEIMLDGQSIRSIKDLEMAKKMAVLKQMNVANVKLTIRELVELGRFPHSKGRLTAADHQAVDQALEYLTLHNIQHQYLDEISGGQRQRAYIAMVVAQDTEYVLLDEPLNNLDMRNSVNIMKILRKLADELGKTIVMVIHDINFASAYADNMVALKDGKLIRAGTVDELMNNACLNKIFGMNCNVQDVCGDKVCVYYKSS
ncbi:MAG: ATP-binding cassette domain-containing protein [Defluviitaleaceae bacterium]|nr:ATP-binding cassette domain-containing protein [Defluviitaleaceae bacterium]